MTCGKLQYCVYGQLEFFQSYLADRSIYLLDSKGKQHQLELPFSTLKDNSSLKNSLAGELHAFFRGKVSNEESKVFTSPSCNFVDGCLCVAYNGCGYRLEETNNYACRALGIEKRDSANAVEGYESRRPVDAQYGKSFAYLDTDLLTSFIFEPNHGRTLASVPLDCEKRSINLFEPKNLSYYPVKYLRSGDTTNFTLLPYYMYRNELGPISCPLSGETVLIVHFKKRREDHDY